MNGIVKTLLVAGAGYTAWRLLSLNKMANNISINLYQFRVHSIGWGGITLGVTANVNNPTSVSTSVNNPVIRLYDDANNMLAESPAQSRRFPIVANGQSKIGELMITIPFLSIISYFNLTSVDQILALFNSSTNKSKTFLSALKRKIYLETIMTVEGVLITTPRTAIN